MASAIRHAKLITDATSHFAFLSKATMMGSRDSFIVRQKSPTGDDLAANFAVVGRMNVSRSTARIVTPHYLGTLRVGPNTLLGEVGCNRHTANVMEYSTCKNNVLAGPGGDRKNLGNEGPSLDCKFPKLLYRGLAERGTQICTDSNRNANTLWALGPDSASQPGKTAKRISRQNARKEPSSKF